jgi:hypothetical protein
MPFPIPADLLGFGMQPCSLLRLTVQVTTWTNVENSAQDDIQSLLLMVFVRTTLLGKHRSFVPSKVCF